MTNEELYWEWATIDALYSNATLEKLQEFNGKLVQIQFQAMSSSYTDLLPKINKTKKSVWNRIKDLLSLEKLNVASVNSSFEA